MGLGLYGTGQYGLLVEKEQILWLQVKTLKLGQLYRQRLFQQEVEVLRGIELALWLSVLVVIQSHTLQRDYQAVGRVLAQQYLPLQDFALCGTELALLLVAKGQIHSPIVATVLVGWVLVQQSFLPDVSTWLGQELALLLWAKE
jgi:hypothetical protein